MSFLTPALLLLGLLAVPILVLYMLKLRRREVEVSSTLLWQLLLRDREANAPWQKLKRNLLLLLQLLILAALVLALARPFIPIPTVASGSVVVLLDASASMNATDAPPSRFESAKLGARDIADGLSSSAVMTLILVGQHPRVLTAAQSDRVELRKAIESAQPTEGSADWNAAFALAAGAAGGVTAERSTIVIISDGGLPDDLPPLPGEVRYVPVGESGDNLAVSALSLRPAADGPELFASVNNYGDAERRVILSLSQNGQLFTAQELSVPPGGSTPIVLSGLPPDGSIYEARLSAPAAEGTQGNLLDSLPTDDAAFAVYQPPVSGRVLFLSKDGNIFVEQMLSVIPSIQPFRAPPAPEGVLLPADGKLPAADLLLINPPSNELFNVTGVFSDTTSVTLAESPLTQFLDWSQVHVLQAESVQLPDWAQVVVSAEGGPLVFAGQQGGRRVVVLTFDLHDSDLPLQIAFPILFSNIIDYLAPSRAFDAPDGLQPGETLSVLPGPGVTQVAIAKPRGEVYATAPGENGIVFADTQELGVYAVNYLDDQGALGADYFAVNLFSEAESNIRPAPSIVVGRVAVPAARRENVGQRELWPWLAGAALLILLGEWWVYHRGSAMPTFKSRRGAFIRGVSTPPLPKRSDGGGGRGVG